MNIVNLLNQIEAHEIVLPAIQRDFVWAPSKISKLMDSIMRGYPIGIVLMWETHNEIQYRRFENAPKKGNRPTFYDNTVHRKLKVVLDGQQRLQSLFLALYGMHENEFVYFDVLSGRHSDDFEEDKFDFFFRTPKEAQEWNETSKENVENCDHDDEPEEPEYLVKVADLFRWSVSEKQQFRRRVTKELTLSDEDQLRLETNIAKLDEVLTKDQNILKASIIDENKPPNSADRQTESDVLEIFVRINRQGTPLSRSDLIFSMLKLSWKESATALPDFVDAINEGNSFEINIDFVIRCLYAVSDLGTRFDIDLLRRKSNMELMQANFDKCCEAIQATIDNVQQHCGISSSKVLGGDQNLIPFVYYFFHTPKCTLPNDQIGNFRKSLFLFGFSSPFSRYADSRLVKFIRQALRPRLENGDYTFPLPEVVKWIFFWERVNAWNGDLLQRNPRLAMHMIQGHGGGTYWSLMNWVTCRPARPVRNYTEANHEPKESGQHNVLVAWRAKLEKEPFSLPRFQIDRIVREVRKRLIKTSR
ncbi:MAG: DUF262 domain-containing protein [Planctomycetota bacterium]|nr:DUF262 domain-containing protein [Planctomycetota bacterium]